MFKRDLFEITDEEPAGSAEVWTTVTDAPGEEAPASRGSERDGNWRHTAWGRVAPLRRSADWHATAALVVGFAGLLLSLAAITTRRVETPSVDHAVARRPAKSDQQNVDDPRRKTGGSVARARAKRPSRVAADEPPIRRSGTESSRPATSTPAPVQPAKSRGCPRPAPPGPVTPPPAEPPRPGEFDFEVGDR